MSSSESIEEAFLSLAEGVINRLSFAGSLKVSVPIYLGVTSWTKARSLLMLSVYNIVLLIPELLPEARLVAALASMLPLPLP